jgi:hypothetical protein
MYGITFQVERDLHPKPIHVQQFLPIHVCNDQVTLTFFVESERKIVPLTIVKQVIDPVTFLILDPYDISDLRPRIEGELKLDVEIT